MNRGEPGAEATLGPVASPTVNVPVHTMDDQTAAFRPAILGVRGATTAASVLLCSRAFTDLDYTILTWMVVVVAYNLVRILQPLVIRDDTASLIRVLFEVGLHVVAVIATGYWESPFVFSLLTAIMVAGFARGFAFGLRIGVTSTLAVSIPHLLIEGLSETSLRTDFQWSTLMILVAAVAGYARRITMEADRQHSLALDRVGRLSDANALLFALHRVAQSLPSSLDLDEVLDSTMTRVDDLFSYDHAALLIYDDTGGGWRTARSSGARRTRAWAEEELPRPAAAAVGTRRLVHVPDLSRDNGPGMAVESRSGLYAPLVGREQVVGVLVVERNDADRFDRRDVDLLEGFVAPAALAVDNALWFNRLRTVGADEERTRIARDLHDRIGQSLAYLSFELDRIVKSAGRGDDVSPALERLRTDVRGVVSEVRDTLYDLRTDVSETSDLSSTLRAHVDRVNDRGRFEVRLDIRAEGRLPLRQERELFLIAQEALANVERHSGAERCLVRYWCGDGTVLLEVRDDGRGFPPGKAGRLDSYGILGMRERAASIGATLDVDSVEGVGSTVRCHLETATT